MSLNKRAPACVPQFRDPFGRAHDVRKEDRGQNALRFGVRGHLAQERLDLARGFFEEDPVPPERLNNLQRKGPWKQAFPCLD